MSAPTYTTACAVYEFRYSANEWTYHDVIQNITPFAKHYVFQLEKGDSGYLHFQGRLSLIKKRRQPEIVSVWNESKFNTPNFIKPTIGEEFKKCGYKLDSAFYQLKEDTKVDGPWTDKDEKPAPLTEQLKLFLSWKLRPYQQSLVDMIYFNMRYINIIYDTTGNCGKSIFAEYLEYQGLAEEVPPYRLMDDIFQWVYCRPKKRCYLFDLPRGMKKDKLADLYSGIEVIKNGVCYDKRHFAKKERMTRPTIFVFTNTLPVLSLMSQDRWKVWSINSDFELVPYDITSLSGEAEPLEEP